MRTVSTYDEKCCEAFNVVDIRLLSEICKQSNTRVEINNGLVTSATQVHRDYVSVYDGRTNYK